MSGRLWALGLLTIGGVLSLQLRAGDWPFYRHDLPGLANAGEALTDAQVPSLQQKWLASVPTIANPVVAGGRVFLTGVDGAFHALDAGTGAELWRHSAKATGPFHCFPNSTSSTTKGPIGAVAVVGNTAFAPGGDGIIYAHDVATGAIRWQTRIADVTNKGEFLWTSGFPLGGRIYFGISSLHDCLLVPGRLVALDQATGQVVGTWWADPNHGPGGGIWTQPAYDAATNRLFVTTGTIAQGKTPAQQPLADAFVAIDPGTMATVDHFTPVSGDYYADVDFGASPVLYDTADGKHWIAATNKNGWVYALNRDNLAAGVVWAHQISGYSGDPDVGLSTIASPTFANGQLFVGGAKTTDGFSGSLAALDPETGHANWVYHPTNGDFFLGALSSTGNVLLASGTHAIGASGTVYILDQSTGHVLWSRDTPNAIFSEPTFANGVLYAGDLATGTWAWHLGTSSGGGGGGGSTGASFVDDFSRTTGLGPAWLVAHGAFSTTGSSAIGTQAQSYAFWTGTPDPAAPVSITTPAPVKNTWIGVAVRASPSAPDANHYAGYIAPDGTLGIGRRKAWAYTTLASGGAVGAGAHVLSLTATGAGPVTLVLSVDGAPVLQAVDTASDALGSGLDGMFDYNGASQPIDQFRVGGTATDGGAGDAGSPDAGAGDAGSPDAGAGDAGSPDAGAGDAGSLDAGAGDAGSPDAGAGDAGTPDGGATPAFSDDFNRTSLGPNWTVAHGVFSDNGTAAVGTAPQSYAFWIGMPDAAASVAATISPSSSTYLGVVARASSASPDANHYAGYVGPDGKVAIARRNAWTYTVLATGPAVSAGAHVLTLQASGATPVVLTVLLDGAKVLQATDSSTQAFTTSGLAGIFDYDGAGRPIDDFTVGGGTPASGGGGGASDGGVDGGTDAGADAGTPSGAIASDSFSGSGALGAGWTVWVGGFSQGSGRATATAAGSYATMAPAVLGDTTVSAVVDPQGHDDVGVLARAYASDGSRNHYAAWMNHDGSIHLARRNSWTYTYLADAAPALSGPHKLELRVSGTGPVHLSVLVDSNPILDYTDSAANALTGSGTGGIFSWQAAGPTFQTFLETQP